MSSFECWNVSLRPVERFTAFDLALKRDGRSWALVKYCMRHPCDLQVPHNRTIAQGPIIQRSAIHEVLKDAWPQRKCMIFTSDDLLFLHRCQLNRCLHASEETRPLI